MLPKTSAYVKMLWWRNWIDVYFIEDDEFLEEYNDIWNKVSNSIKEELDCKPIYNKKNLETKIRSYGSEDTDLHVNEMPKLVSNYACLVVILISFNLKKDENYYSQVLLKEWKYTEKGKTVSRNTTTDLEFSFHESDEE